MFFFACCKTSVECFRISEVIKLSHHHLLQSWQPSAGNMGLGPLGFALSMRKLSTMSRHLAPFGNLCHGLFCSVDLCSRGLCWKPLIPSHKNCIVFNCFSQTISDDNCAIVSSRHVFFSMMTLLKLALCAHPDLARSKNPMESP